MLRALASILTFALVAGSPTAIGAVPPGLDAEEVQRRWVKRLEGKHYTATVKFGMPGIGEKRMTLRWDDTNKRERLLVRFEWPDELRGSSWLMLENNDRANQYYFYSTERAASGARRMRAVRRVNPFAGGEFDYLGARVAREGHPVAKAVESGVVEGRKAFVLTEQAEGMHFEERKIWLDADTFVPLRGEYWRGGKKFLIAETEEIREVQGVATPTRIRFTYPNKKEDNSTTVWQVEAIDYNRPILDSYFKLPR